MGSAAGLWCHAACAEGWQCSQRCTDACLEEVVERALLGAVQHARTQHIRVEAAVRFLAHLDDVLLGIDVRLEVGVWLAAAVLLLRERDVGLIRVSLGLCPRQHLRGSEQRHGRDAQRAVDTRMKVLGSWNVLLSAFSTAQSRVSVLYGDARRKRETAHVASSIWLSSDVMSYTTTSLLRISVCSAPLSLV